MDNQKPNPRDLAIAKAIRDAAVECINGCREDGESDMRTARGRVEGIDLVAIISSIP